MFPLKHRLKLRGNTSFFKQARVASTRAAALFHRSSADATPRVALQIRGGLIKSAVARNAIKRKLRPFVLQALLAYHPTPLEVFFLYKGPPRATTKELASYVRDAFANIRH